MSKANWGVLALTCLCLGLLTWSFAMPHVQAQDAQQARSIPGPAESFPTRLSSTVAQEPGRTYPTPIAAPAGIALPGQQIQAAPAVTAITQSPALPGTAVAPGVMPFNPSVAVTRTMVRGSVSPEESKLIMKTQQIVKKLRDEETEESDEELEDELRDVLEEHFELRMQTREEELAELEDRLNKLREELDSRRSAKREIVDLRHQSLVNEARGLGF